MAKLDAQRKEQEQVEAERKNKRKEEAAKPNKAAKKYEVVKLRGGYNRNPSPKLRFCAVDMKTKGLKCTEKEEADAEEFELHDNGRGLITLKSTKCKQWCGAPNDGTLACDRLEVGKKETFKRYGKGDKIGFRQGAGRGDYCQDGGDRGITCLSGNFRGWETFLIVQRRTVTVNADGDKTITKQERCSGGKQPMDGWDSTTCTDPSLATSCPPFVNVSVGNMTVSDFKKEQTPSNPTKKQFCRWPTACARTALNNEADRGALSCHDCESAKAVIADGLRDKCSRCPSMNDLEVNDDDTLSRCVLRTMLDELCSGKLW